jgi:hypothetical protein
MGMTITREADNQTDATFSDDETINTSPDSTQRMLEFLSDEELEMPGIFPTNSEPTPELDFDIVTPPVFERIPSPNEVTMLDFLKGS